MVTDVLLDEINRGEGVTLSKLAARVPRTRKDRPVNLSTIWRWAMKGAKGPDGKPVRLEAAKLPGGLISSPGALKRFLAALTPSGNAEPMPTRTPGQREKAADRAARKLSRLGI